MARYGMCGMRMLQLCLSGEKAAGADDPQYKAHSHGRTQEAGRKIESMNDLRNVSSSPHVRVQESSADLMRWVLIALLPASLFGIWHFDHAQTALQIEQHVCDIK